MRVHLRARLFACCLLGWPSASTRAQAPLGVVLLETPGLRPELCAALRIQLTDLSRVSCRTEPASVALATRIALASEVVTTERARLAVLLEADPDPGRLRMILVGAERDRAVLAIEEIENRPAPDVDRSLALKVRDTLEALNAGPEPATAQALSRALGPPAPVRSARPSLSLLIEGGAALALGTRTRAAGVFALGVRATRQSYYAELVLNGQATGTTNVQSAVGAVREKQWGLALALRTGRSFGPLSLGVLGEAGWLRANGLGVTRDGHTGERTITLPRFGVGLDLRVRLWRGPADVMVRVAPTLLIDPIRQRFTLDRQPALELERVQAWLPLTFLIELPLRRAGASDDA